MMSVQYHSLKVLVCKEIHTLGIVHNIWMVHDLHEMN
jgi:hypothetical protein